MCVRVYDGGIQKRSAMNDKVFSQAESKLVADFLRQEHKILVSHGLLFWRKSPTQITEWIKAGWKITIKPEKISEAAGRKDESRRSLA